jgi:hypothetical protein
VRDLEHAPPPLQTVQRRRDGKAPPTLTIIDPFTHDAEALLGG